MDENLTNPPGPIPPPLFERIEQTALGNAEHRFNHEFRPGIVAGEIPLAEKYSSR